MANDWSTVHESLWPHIAKAEQDLSDGASRKWVIKELAEEAFAAGQRHPRLEEPGEPR